LFLDSKYLSPQPPYARLICDYHISDLFIPVILVTLILSQPLGASGHVVSPAE